MKPLAAPVLVLVLMGCADDGAEGRLWGTGAGAAAGAGLGRAAAIGTRYVLPFTGAGMVVGATLGQYIGDRIDPPAQRLWAAATVEAAETGKTAAWATASHRGAVSAPGAAWTDRGGRACRALRQEASRQGEAADAYVRDVVACRGSDGSWEVTEPFADPES